MGSVLSALAPIAPTLLLDLALNTAGFIYSAARKTEKFYDAIGTSTYITCSAFTLVKMVLYNGMVMPHPRQLLLLTTTTIWAGRLFRFLTDRVHRLNGDRRFDKVKHKPAVFAIYWFIQAIWIGVVGGPTFSVLAMNPADLAPLGIWDAVGFAMWLTGFAFEVTADSQKLKWQTQHGQDRFNKFIDTGVWSLCRYPNYFGEITLWAGSYLIASSAAPHSLLAKYGFAASPLLTAFLLTRLSGIPIQEKQAKQRFKDNPLYAQYVKKTPLLIPRAMPFIRFLLSGGKVKGN